ncbi:MAG: hypothetical protein ABL958_12180, partial [Bdellovibrionia bacterium]
MKILLAILSVLSLVATASARDGETNVGNGGDGDAAEFVFAGGLIHNAISRDKGLFPEINTTNLLDVLTSTNVQVHET